MFIDGWWDLAAFAEVILVEVVVEDWAILDPAGFGGTFIDSALQVSDIPTVDEVAVVAVARLVTGGEDKGLLAVIPHVLELVGVPDDLVEDGDEALWVGIWTLAAVDVAWVGHVRLVVWRVEVLAIPARREENLSADTVWTVLLWEMRRLWPRDTETGEADCLLLESVAEGAEHWVASEHAKAFWESKKALAELRVLWVGALAALNVSFYLIV